jgi:hypothetical protein
MLSKFKALISKIIFQCLLSHRIFRAEQPWKYIFLNRKIWVEILQPVDFAFLQHTKRNIMQIFVPVSRFLA